VADAGAERRVVQRHHSCATSMVHPFSVLATEIYNEALHETKSSTIL
jgi:hypothetical protein